MFVCGSSSTVTPVLIIITILPSLNVTLGRPGLALGAADLMTADLWTLSSCFDVHPAVGVLV